MQFKSIARLLSCILDLQREPVAVNLAETETDYRQWPLPELSRPLSFCLMVRLATLGHGRKAAKAHFRCRGSAEVFRFAEPAGGEEYGKRLYGFGLYGNLQTARAVQTSMSTLPTVCHGTAALPLADCLTPPDTVLIFAQAYQAMRLVQGWAYHFGPLDQLSLTGNRGVCSECVARPLATGMMHLSALCANTRYAAKWKDHELGIGLPVRRLIPLLDGLIQTIPAVEPLKRRNTIIERCAAAGVELEIPPGTPYFS